MAVFCAGLFRSDAAHSSRSNRSGSLIPKSSRSDRSVHSVLVDIVVAFVGRTSSLRVQVKNLHYHLLVLRLVFLGRRGGGYGGHGLGRWSGFAIAIAIAVSTLHIADLLQHRRRQLGQQ